MPTLSPDLKTLYKKGRKDGGFFVENVVAMTRLWDKQKRIMDSVRDNSRTAVRSCNGAGKTFTTANVVAWFLSSYPNSVVISTAPTARQVEELLWREINNIHKNSKYPLGGRCTNVTWTIDAKWFALGLSTDDPNRFQGFHAEHILGVIDEGAGVEAPIWEAMDAILTSRGARLLVIGNPTEPSGRFYDAFSSPLFNKIHISAFDTPNFTEFGITIEDLKTGEWNKKVGDLPFPSLITPQWAYERLTEWGEDSPAFQARIGGNFPIIGTDTMLPLGWVLRAAERELETSGKGCYMAVDVARFGDDESVIGIRRGNSVVRQEVLHNADTYVLSRAAKMVADEENPSHIKVDANGWGAGVADNLRAWGYNTIDYLAQNSAWQKDKHVNKRTESWYNLRERFRNNSINLPKDEQLIGQLTAPKYKFDAAGRYVLESKEDIKKRGLPSPDKADVVAMLFDSDIESTGTEVVRDLKAKPGTVAALLRELSQGEESELKWVQGR